MTTSTLLRLPNELLLMFAESLPTFRDLRSLILVNRHLAQLLTPLILRQAAHLQTAPLSLVEHNIFDPSLDCEWPYTKKRSVLHWAAAHGDCDLIETIVAINKRTSRGHSTLLQLINGLDSFGMSPLHSAALNKHTRAVELLLQHGAQFDYPGQNLASPLLFAVYWKLHDMVAGLLRAGADPNSYNPWFGTLLHLAVANNDPVSADMLARAGANLNATFLALTPLTMSYWLKFHDITLCLTESSSEPWRSPREMQQLVGAIMDERGTRTMFGYGMCGLGLEVFNGQLQERDFCARCKRCGINLPFPDQSHLRSTL